MNKLNAIIVGVLLLTVATAGLSPTDTNLKLSLEDKNTLASIGITNPQVSELICDAETCKATLKQERGINIEVELQRYYTVCGEETLESDSEVYVDCTIYEYTLAQLEDMKIAEIKLRLEMIAQVTRDRQNIVQEEKLGGGIITITS